MKFWNFATIKNEKDNTESVELRIEGEIVSNDDAWIYEWFEIEHTAPNVFKDELSKYKGKDIIVWIDSYGGDVFAAAGIYNALKEHKGKVTVKIDGKAMSAASVIAMAGDEVLMSPVAIMMIHNPLTIASGDMREMRKTAEILDAVKETIVNAYVNKTGLSGDKISSMMDDETWMSANVAVKNGFADGVLYEDKQIEVSNIKDFAYNRFAIVNSTNEAIKKLFAIEKKQIDNNKNLEKEKLLIELDLI
ncbi:head maturation protease, ClpP-related [Tepidibacter thalassicus]|uniref:ATP-dependent Clp protease proteolytic subunit n=1 Tax=Tepidibacter thalassicus DSM 15285 TaxID=1123350 RepID=A0A1M5PVY6_9FIRM|nr:head maturation protease, ClpP-related [Tepidibacter thalassicus]SHH05994.1 ATP-dependent Clp protease, protease subunit [Tepidibacter thalassicus DSM 15285]